MGRVGQILDLKLSEGEITLSNQEAKILFYIAGTGTLHAFRDTRLPRHPQVKAGRRQYVNLGHTQSIFGFT